MKMMSDNVRRAYEMFWGAWLIFSSILISLKFSSEDDPVERRHMVFLVAGFALVSVAYAGARIAIEKKKEISNQKVDPIN
jgi:hypothetical protein